MNTTTTTAPVTDIQSIFDHAQASKIVSLFDDYINRWYSIIGFVIVALLVLCGCIQYIVSRCRRIRKYSDNSNFHYCHYANYDAQPMLNPVNAYQKTFSLPSHSV